MNTLALNKLLEYILALSLSDKNKDWLAEKIIESKKSNKTITPKLAEELENARKEIREGECTKCSSPAELQSYLDSL